MPLARARSRKVLIRGTESGQRGRRSALQVNSSMSRISRALVLGSSCTGCTGTTGGGVISLQISRRVFSSARAGVGEKSRGQRKRASNSRGSRRILGWGACRMMASSGEAKGDFGLLFSWVSIFYHRIWRLCGSPAGKRRYADRQRLGFVLQLNLPTYRTEQAAGRRKREIGCILSPFFSKSMNYG